MSIKFFFLRMVNTRPKRILLLFMLFFPLFELFMQFSLVMSGAAPFSPDSMTFLHGYTSYRGFSTIIWFMPLYFLFLAGDMFIEDNILSYNSLLWMRKGRRSYISKSLTCGFLSGFCIMLIILLFNYLIAQVLFHGGTYFPGGYTILKPIPYFPDPSKHKALVNLFYILFASIVGGITSIGASALSILIHNRFIVYPIVFAGWYLPISFKNTIIYALQPFSEYTIGDAIGAIIFVIIFNFSAVAALLVYNKFNPWWREVKGSEAHLEET